MSNSPILNLPLVAPNQNQKETTINSSLAILEAACNDDDTFSLSAGNRTLTATEFTRVFHMIFDEQTAAREVTVPATPRFFAVSNNGDYNITVKVGGIGTTTEVEPDKRVLMISDGVNVMAISAGISLLSSLSDVTGALDAAEGQLLAYDSDTETWGPVDNFAEHGFFYAGEPTSSVIVYRRVITRQTRLFSDFSGAQSIAGVAAAASTTFTVKKNNVDVGTITFALGSTTATFSTDVGSGSTSVTFTPGDWITILAPASPDADLADIAVTLKGVYL